MKISLSATTQAADILFITLYKDEKLSAGMKKTLGINITKAVEERMKAKDFEGNEGQKLELFPSKNLKKVVIIGRGDKNKQMPNATENLGGTLASLCKGKQKVAVFTDKDDLYELSHGFILGAYEFTSYKKTDKKAKKLEQLIFITDVNKENNALANSLKIYNDTSTLLRNLVNTPSGDLKPDDIVAEARKLAKKYKMTAKVFDEKQLTKMGCGGLVGVGRGGEVGAKMVVLEYKHNTKNKQPNLAFVGKGITFDTGGLNLKPTGYIETMKQDMAGAATVLGTMQAIAEAKLKGYFVGVLCCAENSVSDRSTRPGDVLKAYNGKTIEVTNTDAEGRLVLADGLAYTEKKYHPKVMVNIATLTGAVSVALGYNITGIMGNDQKLLDEILKLSKDAHERMWQLPLDEDFVKATEGTFTDLKNSSDGVRAGSSMGGAFLKNFVDKVKWAHFDIGGTAWTDKPTSTTKYGATAAALRTFIELAKKHAG